MRLKEYLERITEGMAIGELWAQFRSEAKATYSFYAHDLDWKSLERLPGWKRVLKVAWALFWAMLMHLSPTRRVLLLISLLLVILGAGSARIVVGSAAVTTNQSPFAIYGALGLLLVLALELTDRVVMKRDLQIAKEIQQWLVPSTPPSVKGAEIAFATQAANTVGGDFYDAIVRSGAAGEGEAENVLLVVADVAGKSVPAAILMATFQASLHALCSAVDSLEDLTETMNRSACTRSAGGRRFTTAFFAEFVPASGELRFINAGHNYPYVRRAEGTVERLSIGGLPLGIQEDGTYSMGATILSANDLLLVFTDGVVEAVDEKGEEFGDQRLEEIVAATRAGSAERLQRELREALSRFTGQARQHDDLTWLILLKRDRE